MTNFKSKSTQWQPLYGWDDQTTFKFIEGSWYYGNPMDGYVPIKEISHDDF